MMVGMYDGIVEPALETRAPASVDEAGVARTEATGADAAPGAALSSDDEMDGGFGTVLGGKRASGVPATSQPTGTTGARQSTNTGTTATKTTTTKEDKTKNAEKEKKTRPQRVGAGSGREWDQIDSTHVARFEAALATFTKQWPAATFSETSEKFKPFWTEQVNELKTVSGNIKSKIKSCKRRTGMENPARAFDEVDKKATSLLTIAKEMVSNKPSADTLQLMSTAKDEYHIDFPSACWLKKAKARQQPIIKEYIFFI